LIPGADNLAFPLEVRILKNRIMPPKPKMLRLR